MIEDEYILGLEVFLNQMVEEDKIRSFKIQQKEKSIHVDVYILPVTPLSSMNIEL